MKKAAATTPAILWHRIVRLLWQIPLLAVTLAFVAVGGLFLRSDIVSFRPRLPSIRQKIEAQRAATPALPPFLVQCMKADGDPSHFIARLLLGQHGLDETTSLRRHVRALFWSWSLHLHLSESELVLLHGACMPDGKGGRGIHHLSQRLHGKPINQLNDRQMIELVVVSGSPARFFNNPGLLKRQGDDLMSRIKVP